MPARSPIPCEAPQVWLDLKLRRRTNSGLPYQRPACCAMVMSRHRTLPHQMQMKQLRRQPQPCKAP